MKKRFTALLLSVMMLISIIPSPVFAQQTEEILPEEDVNAQIEEMIPAEESPQEIISVETTVETLLAASTVASGTCGESLTWTLDDEGTLTISGTGKMTDWSYSPSAPWRSVSSSIKSVVINNGVTSIGDWAFYDCGSLASITIHGSVTSIGKYAFYDCASLAGITIPEGVASIGDLAFSECSSLNGVTIAGSVTSIGGSAFSHCTSLTDITIPESVTSIGDWAFFGCKSLAKVNVASENKNYSSDEQGILYDKNKTNLVACPGAKTGHITIPESVTSIGYGAFSVCSSLAGITIPEGVTSIGEYAFYSCSNLSDVYYGGSESDWSKITIGKYNDILTSVNIHHAKTDGPEIISNGTCGTNLTWTLDEEGTLTISGTGDMTNWSHPSYAPWNKYMTLIKYVVINDGVTSIGDSAFGDSSSLISIDIPGSVTSIGNYAFDDCSSLANAVIADGVTRIGDYAFGDCSSLISIDIPGSVTSIGKGAFYHCTGFTSVSIPASVTIVNSSAFEGCSSLMEVKLSEGIRYIGSYAFSNCSSLVSIVIPKSVTTMDDSAFPGCRSLEKIEVAEGNLNYSNDERGILYNKDKTRLIICPPAAVSGKFVIPDAVTSLGSYAFYDCDNITDITIHSGLKTIGYNTFSECEHIIDGRCGNSLNWVLDRNGTLTVIGSGNMLKWSSITQLPAWSGYADRVVSVVINNGATNIGDYAFEDFVNLMSITIPDSVTSIGNSAFYNCSSLMSITIPDSVTSIGDYVFYNCDSIKSINIPNSIKSISNYAFCGCGVLTDITIPDSVTRIGNSAFRNCDSLMNITIPDSVKSIEDSVFEFCRSLVSIRIPDSVTSIGDSAFKYCDSLVSITIPDSVTSIGESVFYSCDALRSITIPGSIATISKSSFSWCRNLTNVVISNGVKNIVNSAFINCYNLREIVMPKSVSIIGNDAFSGCSFLSDVYYDGSEADWQLITVGTNNTALTGATLHYNTYAGYWAASQLWTLDSEGTLHIKGSGKMYGWEKAEDVPWNKHKESIKTVLIDSGVTGIGNYAFDGCENLADIYYGGSEAEWENIVIGTNNDVVSSALIHCNATTANHTKTEQKVADANCDHPAQYKYVCNDCGAETELYTKDNILGHKSVVDAAVEPDCINTGLTEGSHCSECSEVLVKQEIVDALGHTEVVDKAVEPTCTETGLTEGKHCSVCDEVLVKQEVIDALGHTEEIDKAVEPTCTETGLTEGKHCSVCDEVLVEQTVIPTKLHSWDEGTPDAENPEVKTFTCTVCGETVEGTKAFLFMMKIDEFDGVEITHAHEETVLALKDEYDSLSDEEKSLVENYSELETLIKTFEHYHKGDVNLDGTINSTDLSELLSAYGTRNEMCDIKGDDGLVNSTDLSTLLAGYGTKR